MRKGRKKQLQVRFHEGLERIREHAAGIDVGAEEIWVDVGLKKDARPVRVFSTFTCDSAGDGRMVEATRN